ncbi:MAG: hypothetical protein NVSMB10_19670 [Steroidobacteraceae bacterium]
MAPSEREETTVWLEALWSAYTQDVTRAGDMRLERPLSAGTRQILQTSVDHAYAEFLLRVSQGRKKSVEEVDKIAQGRVWAGTDAQRIGLVDHLGGLKDAVEAAAKIAELGADYGVDYIERVRNLREELMMQLRVEGVKLAAVLGVVPPHGELESLAGPLLDQVRSIARLNDPRGLYAYCWCQAPRAFKSSPSPR